MKLLDLQAQYAAYRKEMDAAIAKVVSSGIFIGGEEIGNLEKELANFCGAVHAVACSSGTDALLLALMAGGVRAGDEVITSPFTFIATAEAPCYLGAKPVFLDVDRHSYLLDAQAIEAAITPNTKAIMPVSLFGLPCDHVEIAKIAERHGLLVVEDAAQSFGAQRGGDSCNLSELACTSFFPAKPLGCYGDGGAVFTRSAKIAQTVRQLLNHGSAKRYYHDVIGMNARLDSLQAAILRVKLRYFDKERQARREIALRYDQMLKHPLLTTPFIPPGAKSVYAQYCPVLASQELRDRLGQHLQKKNIPYAIYYPIPLHQQKAFAHLGYKSGDFPVSEDLAKRIIALPLHPFLSRSQQDEVVAVVLDFLANS